MGVLHRIAVNVGCVVDNKAKDCAFCVLETALAEVLQYGQCGLELLKTEFS